MKTTRTLLGLGFVLITFALGAHYALFTWNTIPKFFVTYLDPGDPRLSAGARSQVIIWRWLAVKLLVTAVAAGNVLYGLYEWQRHRRREGAR